MFAPVSMTSLSMPGGLPEYQQQQHHQLDRRPSLSWRPDAGLPPPPSEIDQYRNLDQALIPSTAPLRGNSPSSYNLQFGGQDSTADGMPLNAVTKHPKLKLRITLERGIYEAGESITGSLEITSSTSQRLRLGEIAIELEAFEELTSRDHSATQTFLFNRTLFQGEHLPPSNAVLPTAPVQGHWTARKGRTTFPFSFRLPATAPSSANFAGNAHLRYSLKGSAQTWWNETKSIVTVRSDAFVVERWQDEHQPRFLEPIEAVADTHIFMGGSGAVWLEAGVTEQLFAAGGLVTIRAGVKNSTKRHISGMKVCIARRLIFPVCGLSGAPAQRQSLEPQITEVVHTQMFKGPSYDFPPNEEVVANLAVDVPRDVRTIRKTRLFEVQVVAQVSVQMGNFAKDLTVEIPIYVAHPSSLQRVAATGPLQALHKLPQRSRSAMSQHGYHDLHSIPSPVNGHGPYMMPMDAYGAGRGWSPAPYGVGMGPPPSRPSSAAPNVGTASHPAYSPSTEQFTFSPGRLGQEPQIMWDTNAPDWRSQVSIQQLQTSPAYTQQLSQPQHPTNEGRHFSAPLDAAPSAEHMYSNITQEPQSRSPSAETHSPSLSSPASPSSPPQSGITISQLLSLGAIPVPGLTTIEEDSESAAGTVRSMRTLVGSVGRNDIAHFEAMVDEAEEEEDRNRDTMRGRSAQDYAADENLTDLHSVEELEQRRWPEALQVCEPSATSLSPLPSSPTNSKVNAKPASLSEVERTLTVVASSARPPSAQGQGLSALETRLGSQRQEAANSIIVREGSIPKPNLPDAGSKAQDSRRSDSGGLRAAAAIAMQRERKARQDAEESTFRRQTQLAQAKSEEQERKRQQEEARQELERLKQERADRMEAKKAAEALRMKQLAEEEIRERKASDEQEQKKLNKEAVGRIAGWLSSSPSSSKGVGEDDTVDFILTPKTPSPSVFRQGSDEEARPPFGMEGINSSGTVNDLTPSISADLRALIDSTDARPIPKQGTAIHRRIGTRRFSGNAEENSARVDLKDAPKKVSIPSAASRGIPVARSAASGPSMQIDVKKIDLKKLVLTEESQKYDVRSARGGKGGRVASVANMWASIADGTDGSMTKSDDAPVLTLRPKALRSGVSGSSALDFTKPKTEEIKKPSAMHIFASPSLASSEAIRSPLKTKKAATFVNTTSPKPVFAKVSPPTLPSARVTPAHRLNAIKSEEEIQPGQLRESRRLASDLIAKEAAKLKTGRDLLVESDPDLLLLPMNGRGTTKPIGRSKLADLRSIWGS